MIYYYKHTRELLYEVVQFFPVSVDVKRRIVSGANGTL